MHVVIAVKKGTRGLTFPKEGQQVGQALPSPLTLTATRRAMKSRIAGRGSILRKLFTGSRRTFKPRGRKLPMLVSS
jgi:hypothetical protein